MTSSQISPNFFRVCSISRHVIPVRIERQIFRPESVMVTADSGSELKKCPILSVLPGMTGGNGTPLFSRPIPDTDEYMKETENQRDREKGFQTFRVAFRPSVFTVSES